MQAYTDRDAISASSVAPVREAVKVAKKPRKRRLTAAS
jgi:hypothetical protein